MHSTVIRVVGILWALLSSWALSASEFRVGPIYVDRFPEIEAVVEVPASVGSPVVLPAAKDLTLMEDGSPTVTARSVRSFRQTGQGIAVVVAVDVSGTMKGEPLEQTRRSLLALLADLQPQDKVALVSFADDVRVEAPFGSPAAQVRAKISGLAPRGRITELYRALFQSLSLFTPELPARRRILVISDGRDEGEAYKLDDVVQRALSAEVPVDAIGLTRVDPKYLSTLERLSSLSGGFYSPAGDVQDIVRKGLERVRSTPVATFEVQNLKRDGQSHRLGVRWQQGGRLQEGETRVALLSAQLQATPGEISPGGRDDDDWKRAALWIGVSALLLGVAIAVWRRLSSRRRGMDLSSQLLPAPTPMPARSPTEFEPGGPAAGLLPLASLKDDLPLRPMPPRPLGAAEPMAQVAPPPARKPASRGKTQFRHEFSAPAAGHPTAMLVGEEGALSGQRFPIEQDPFWMGAAEDNQLRVERDEFLSSHHACIRFQDGTLLLYDNRSTNGTFVNGERLAEPPHPVGPGDRIRVGRSNFVLMIP